MVNPMERHSCISRKRALCHRRKMRRLYSSGKGRLPYSIYSCEREYRTDRIIKVYGERNESPEQRIKEKDKKRAAYYHFYTDMKWGYAMNYHISLNSVKLGIDKCVETFMPIKTMGLWVVIHF